MTNKGYKRFDRRISRKLSTLKNMSEKDLIAIMNNRVQITRNEIYNNTPVRTGELRRNVFGDVYLTGDGVACEIGISNALHNPDKFTNTQLAGWLLAKPNAPGSNSSSQADMGYILDVLNDFKNDIRKDIEDYYKSKMEEIHNDQSL